jgi:hypothetical protein
MPIKPITRPPRGWWQQMKRRVKRQYPGYSEKRISQITAGIYKKYPKAVKIRLRRKYAGKHKSNPGRKRKKYTYI